MTEDAKKFREKHKKTYEKQGYVYVEKQRTYTNPTTLIENTLKKPYVQERCKTIKIENKGK